MHDIYVGGWGMVFSEVAGLSLSSCFTDTFGEAEVRACDYKEFGKG